MERRDFIGLIDNEEGFKQLVFYQPRSNLGDLTELSISKKTLIQYPNITIANNLLDAHLYIFNHWIIEHLSTYLSDSSSGSIKCALLPKLVQLQEQYNHFLDHSPASSLHLNHLRQPTNNESAKQRDDEDRKPENGKVVSPFVPPVAIKSHSDLSYIYSSNRLINIDNLRCLAFILEGNTYCGRANMNHTYHAINLDVAKGMTSYIPNEPKLKPDACVAKSAVIPETSIVRLIVFFDWLVGL